MNLIMQHWNGDLPRWAQLAERTVREYAEDIGVEYELGQMQSSREQLCG